MKSIQQLTSKDILDLLKKIDTKTWIKIGLAAAGVISFLIVVGIPAWFERPGVKSRMRTLEDEISVTNGLILKRPELERNKQDSIKFIQGAKQQIYLPGESSLLLGAISKLGEESHISIIASKPKNYEGKLPEPFNAQYEANQYDFTVEGGYHDLATFVSRIESNPKLLRVQSFYLRPQEEKPQNHLADISLSAVSFKKEIK